MARNHEKYDYAELAFLRNSDLYRALQADAAASGQPIGVVAMLRLADYYAGRRIEPSTGSLPPLASQPMQSSEQRREQPVRTTDPMIRPVAPLSPPAPPPMPTLGQAVEEQSEDIPDPELNEDQARNNIAAFLSGDDGFSL